MGCAASSTRTGLEPVGAASAISAPGVVTSKSSGSTLRVQSTSSISSAATSVAGEAVHAFGTTRLAGPVLLDLLPGRSGPGACEDVWAQAALILRLNGVLDQHPYLEPNCSAQTHPLQQLVERCRKSCEARSFPQAHKHMNRLLVGLASELELSEEAFALFDHDCSGHLDEQEFQHMCAYLGWNGDDGLEVMDLDGDGRVTLKDMQSFAGYMGGVQELFHRRRLRISTSRKDASEYTGIAVGACVRSHFYVTGQKSQMWREARVVAVDVEMIRGGIPTGMIGLRLEFSFGPGERWRTRQVVPQSWVLGTVEDPEVFRVLREIGILEHKQSLWPLLMPETELLALRQLSDCQRNALAKVRQNAKEKHKDALPGVLDRFKEIGYTDRELQAVLGWVQDLAPLVIHVPLDETGRFLETDEYFRNQFEIIKLLNRRGKGNDEHERFGWESDLFGEAYDEAEAFERVKYGAMDNMNDYFGVWDVTNSGYGDSYVVLKDVRLRTSFTFEDSCSCSLDDMGTLDMYAHVLENFDDDEIHALVNVATAAIAPESQGVRHDNGPARLELLRGTTQDSNSDWITVGFPGLQQSSGSFYFEVLLLKGCRSAQVGVLSNKFEKRPYTNSATGVGDDEHGWAVDGEHCARWHAGLAEAWGTSWPCTEIDENKVSKRGSERALSEDIVVGVAVDLNYRKLYFSTNGVWDDAPVFGPNDIPTSVSLYPALSLKGRAAFILGPGSYRHGPPPPPTGSVTKSKMWQQWPGTFGGLVRVDCPELGDSHLLSGFKEYQVHGEVSLKRNVQRLVAHPKYREKQKTDRSYALRVPGAFRFSGTYRRCGALHGRTLYKSDAGGSIFWDAKEELWKISSTEEADKFDAWASHINESTFEPPRVGWHVPDYVWGVVEADPVKITLENAGVDSTLVEAIMEALIAGPDDALGPPGSGRSTPAGINHVFRAKGDRSLKAELERMAQPAGLDDNEVWGMAVKQQQRRLLDEAGLPSGAAVVESSHPYTGQLFQEVKIDGAKSLMVYFASKSCTNKSGAEFEILAGGLDSDAAGCGACVEIPVAGARLKGTVVERSDEGRQWKVCLTTNEMQDGPRQDKADLDETTEDLSWVTKGCTVEALYVNGHWYKARVSEILMELDWYSGKWLPAEYVINWLDGEHKDCEKQSNQMRKPRQASSTKTHIADMERYGQVAIPNGESFVLCHEEPKVLSVSYGDENSDGSDGPAVGSEIASFCLDRSYPLTPISVQSFVASGPAQEQGIQTHGWFLDIVTTVQRASRKKAMAEVLEGLGGISPCGENLTDQQLKAHLRRLLDAGFDDLEELVRRLNVGLLAMTGVSLYFTNSATTQRVQVLQDAIVVYAKGQMVGSEVKLFTSQGASKQIQVETFAKRGPAQAAGVRLDWVLNVSKTQMHNPGKVASLQEEALRKNPNALLSMSDVTLIFSLPDANPVPHFSGCGPANSETWACKELPGSSARFNLLCRGGFDAEPEQSWGVWALVLPADARRPSQQETDKLAQRWVEVADMSRGVTGKVEVERDDWDEARLRALCSLHGWEFEWMTEDGERRRRMDERGSFLKDAGGLKEARKKVKAATKVQEARRQNVIGEPADPGDKPKVPMVDAATQYDPPS